jgi:cation transport ATPase
MVVSEADGRATMRVVEGAVLDAPEDSVIGLEDSRIDSLLSALTLAARARVCRRRASVAAWILLLLTVPLAAFGVIPFQVAFAVALTSWLSVAIVAAAGIVGVRPNSPAVDS